MDESWSFQPSLQQAAQYAPALRLNLGASSSSSSNSTAPATHSGHTRAYSLDSLQQPPAKRTRQNWYPSEEARLAAKQVQKSRRREQNRNAQRRLRDRKEEHIFNLEGEVSRLRKQHEEQKAVENDLEDMLRRLVTERDELQRRLSLTDQSAHPPLVPTNVGRARSSSAHAFLPSMKEATRPSWSEHYRSAVADEVICESPENDAEEADDGGYPLSALPFAQAAEGRMRSLSLHMPKAMLAGQTWNSAPSSHLTVDKHRASDSPRESEPLSAQSSGSGYSSSSLSMTTPPLSTTKPQALKTMTSVMLTHPARWDGN